jgi:ABC-type branched-subunit amino acid transport system substrate-binding protein
MSRTPRLQGFSRDESRIARARFAPGRFLVLLGILGLGACQGTGTGGPVVGPDGVAPPPPVIVAPGPISNDDQREARALYASAQASAEAARHFEALRTIEDLLTRFPASDVSGEALRLSAEAQLAIGQLALADAAADRYLGLLPARDPRANPVRLIQSSARAGDPAAQLRVLLRIDDTATGDVLDAAAPMVREAADSLSLDGLLEVVDDIEDRSAPLVPVADARLAVALLESGETEQAELYASLAIDGGARDEDLAWAEGVLRGEFPEGRGRVTEFSIGLVLPSGGPPALAEFSALVQEGVEVALSTVLGPDYTVSVLVRDDQGDPTLTAEAITELEAEGVVGVIGLLMDDELVAAGQARTTPIPLISPTARSAAQAGDAVYSLESAEPEAAAAVARYAASRAFQRIAIVHPQTPDAAIEADAFEATAAELGMPVVGRFAYEAGATFFEPQIRAARDALRSDELRALRLTEDDTLHMEALEPAAIFLPIPPEDVEFLAPQLIHFGLDTLAIELLGTSGWTDPQTLQAVDPRHTTGVVATAAVAPEADTTAAQRFRDAYEQRFQRTLVGSAPDIGYDAALLLLEALRAGRVEPEALKGSMERLSGVEGATGLFSIIDGRVARWTEVVRIDDRVLVPESAGWPSADVDSAASVEPGRY